MDLARASMRKLSERGVDIPAQVALPIIEADKVGDLKNASPELERKFWSAYGVLNSKIKSAEEAKDYYRHFFYGILTVLLLLQLYHSACLAVQARLVEVGKALQSVDVANVAPGTSERSSDRKSDLEREQNTYLHVTHYLMGFPRTIAAPFSAFDKTVVTASDKEEVVAKVELELATSFVGGFLLPVLYGMLGAIAFVLRRLSDDNLTREAGRQLRNRYSLRVPIGALSGLAAGWLLQPSAGSVTASLSPFALAFVAGYGSDLVFAAMDRIVAAFTTSPGAQPVEPQVTSSTEPPLIPPPSQQAGDDADDDAHEETLLAGADDGPIRNSSEGSRSMPSSRAQANQDT